MAIFAGWSLGYCRASCVICWYRNAFSFGHFTANNSALRLPFWKPPWWDYVFSALFFILQRCCKSLPSFWGCCRISTILQLPQSFWPGRFDHGMELDFAHQASVTVTGKKDWRSLYFKVRDCLRDEAGIKNRKRIWDSLRPIANLGEFYFRGQLFGNRIKQDLSELLPSSRLIYKPLVLAQTLSATSISKESRGQITFTTSWIILRLP